MKTSICKDKVVRLKTSKTSQTLGFIAATLVVLAMLLPRLASADLVGPYTLDANTPVLMHFDEPSGTTTIANVGALGKNFLAVTVTSGALNPDLMGATGYSTNSPAAISFGGCVTNGTANNSQGLACDYNNDGAFTYSTTVFSDYVPISALGMGNGTNTPWTVEALVQPSVSPLPNQTCCIVTADSANNTANSPRRALLFRIIASGGVATINLVAVNVPTGVGAATASLTSSGVIPSSGPDALVANAWYHMAATYDGTNVTIYWTRLDPANGAAHVLTVTPQTLGAGWGNNSSPLIIGNTGRNGNSAFPGCIDEVRISSVCRAANEMQFYSPVVTIVQNPAALQNVDYNQPVAFTVAASTTGSTLGYQWRFNSNAIAGATSPTYTIPNVAAFNAGYYDCVVTNTAGYSNMTTEAQLVVGAANFLSHRYSFNTNYIDPTSGLVCTPDSIGAANGTNFGNANFSGGQLVLDGTTGTYMLLPGGLYTSSSATALTVEFWATFGANPNNTWFYLFNSSYNGVGGPPAGFFGFLCNNGSGLPESRGARSLQVDESVIAPNSLNGVTMHVACTYDPPNKTIAIYTNGVLAAINTNAPVAMANVSDTFSFIGCIGSGPGPFLNASIDEFRMYNGALSPITLKQSDDQGPNVVLASGPVQFAVQPANTTVPVGQTATFTAAAVGYLPISYQWFKNGAPVHGATNASYSFVAELADNSSNFLCYATNNIGVTTYSTNSATATLTVFLPPTLTWLGLVAGGGADNTWNTSSLDWTNDLTGGGLLAFAQTNGVLFDDRGSGGSVDVAEAIIPYQLTVNAAADYLLTSSSQAGSLTGQGLLTKLNTGTLVLDLTNRLAGPTTIAGGKLQIGNYDASGSLGGGPVTNNAVLSFTRYDTTVVPNVIHGSGTMSFDGSGITTVSGASDYTGSTLLNNGIVQLISGTGLGATSSGTLVASGGQLYLTANINLAEPLTLNGSGDGNGALRKGGAGASTETAPIYLAGDTTIGVDSGSTLVLSNTVSGAAVLTASGSGTLTLTKNESLNGFNLNGSVVNVLSSGALGTNTVTVSGAGRFIIGDGLTIANPFVATTISAGAGLGLLMVNNNTNNIVTTLSGPIEFDASPANGGNFVGPTSSGYLNVTGPVTNNNTGTVTARLGYMRFSGGGSYTAFTIGQGTTSIGANNGVCTNATLAVAVSAAGAFDLNGFNQALAGLSDVATIPAVVTNSAATPSTLTLNLGSGGTFYGNIAGNISLVENGSANYYLAGTNTYTGNTTINGGTLELAQPTLSAWSTVSVASGAQLQLDFTSTNNVAALILNGATQPLGVYNSTTSPTFITGSGSLLVAIPVATNPTNLVPMVNGSNLNLSWPADHIGWRLETQTNSLNTGISTNWNVWPGSDTTNSVSVPIGQTNPSVFFRLVYP